MIVELTVLGGLWWLSRDERGEGSTDEKEAAPDAPTPPPQAVPTGEDSYRVEKVGSGDKNNIYLLQTRFGVLYDDGRDTRQWEDTGFIRGDFPTGFVSGSAGGISFEINEIYYENVVLYSTKEDAIEADKDKETTPDSPMKPEEPQEPAPVAPVVPVTPRGGLGNYTPFGGGF